MVKQNNKLSALCRESPLSLAVAAVIGSSNLAPALQAQEDASSEEAIDEVVVTGKLRFREKEVDSAMKMTMPAKDIPQSVTIITEDLMRLASISRLDDVYKVDASSGTSHRLDQFPSGFYRGFDTQGPSAVRVDGFRFIANIDLNFAAMERFELVKGPTSTMNGQTDVGGSVNLVPKRPTDEDILDIEFNLGANNQREIGLDWGGALNDSGTITGRFIAAYEETESYVAVVEDEDTVLAPSLTFQLGEETALTTALMYQHSEGVAYFGTGGIDLGGGQVAVAQEVLGLGRSAFVQLDGATDESDATLVFLKLEHGISDSWRLRLSGQYSEAKRQTLGGESVFVYADTSTVSPSTFGHGIYDNDFDEALWGLEANLIGDIELFGREHTIFLGLDYAEYEKTGMYGFAYLDEDGGPTDNDTALPLSGYGSGLVRGLNFLAFDDYLYQFDITNENVFAGFTAQVMLRPTDDLTVMLGGRFSYDEVKNVQTDLANGLDPVVTIDHDDSEFIGQIGIVYALNDDVNLYANYGETYEPTEDRTPTLDANGNPVRTPNPDFVVGGEEPEFINKGQPGVVAEPEKGDQLEIGFKGDFFDDRVSMSGAIFDITRANLRQDIRGEPGLSDFSEIIGEQQSRGVEFNMAGNVTSNWTIFVSAAYIDAEYIDGDLSGLRPTNTPEVGLSIIPAYEFLDGVLAGWRVSMTYVYKDLGKAGGTVPEGVGSFGAENRVAVIDFGETTEIGLSVGYEGEQWSFYLEGTNLTNELDYVPSKRSFQWGMFPNPGRAWEIGVSYSFY